jgi:cytochrome c biogenesis protein CcmG, thiol:disulfide interchange protein DsbE
MSWRSLSRFALQGLAVALVASLVGLLVWQVTTKDAGAGLVGAVEDGEKPAAPPIELPALDGDDPISLADYRGKAVVLNFWASWCEPCKREVPMLEDAWRRYRDRGLVVLGVDAQDFERDARRFVERYGLTYPIAYDGPGESLPRYGLSGFPETWWIDRRGRLVAYSRGEFTREELERNIARALESA